MLIDDLIRLGRPLLAGDMRPEEVLRLVTDVADERVKNFYRNVFVVYLPPKGEGGPRALPRQIFGEEKERNFIVNERRALGATFVLPSGGNPLNPQGRYGLPVYPLYDPHLTAFLESAEGVEAFLTGRLERTPGFDLDEGTRSAVAGEIHRAVGDAGLDESARNLGVLVLARCEAGGFYSLGPTRAERHIGLVDDRAIVPDFGRILEAVWAAKIEEGRAAGSRPGPCIFTGAEGEAVSAYCKAWPWAFPTWTCPLPNGGDESLLVEGIGISPETYRALTLGACVFNRLADRLTSLVSRELFSPVDTRPGKEQAQERNLTTIQGSAFLLPVQDGTLAQPDHAEEFVMGVRRMLAFDPKDPTQADRSLAAVAGFDVFLPEDLDKDDYRLTLVYFSGDYTRGDVKLRAYIQDVVPSTAGCLRMLALREAEESMRLIGRLMPKMSEKQRAYVGKCYQSIPYLLARAYGGGYLWTQLEAALRRRRLEHQRVTVNTARRLESLVPTWPASLFAIRDEVAFYLNFLRFLGRYRIEIAGLPEDQSMPIRHWKELLAAVDTGPVADLAPDDPAELGFACGALIRRFSRAYYKAAKRAKPDADYLRDRVLTFGSDLRPSAVHDKGLKLILELPNRMRDLRLSRDLRERVGAVINAFQRQREDIERNKDAFLTAFWAGYALQGYDRPPKPTVTVTTTQSPTQE